MPRTSARRSRRWSLWVASLAGLQVILVIALVVLLDQRAARRGSSPELRGAAIVERSSVARRSPPPQVASDTTGSVGGHVLDADGMPVPDATVRVACGDGVPTAELQSDRDGAFVLDDLLPGSCLVDASDRTRASSPVLVHVEHGRTEIVVILGPAAHLTVRVLSGRDRAPIESAEVAIRSVDMFERAEVLHRRTDREGRATFPVLPPGSYRVAAAAPGHAGVERLLAPHTGLAWSEELILAPGSPIRGRVIDASGRGVAGAVISPMPADAATAAGAPARWPFSTRSGASGQFELPAVAAGALRLRAWHRELLPGTSGPLVADGASPIEGVEIALVRGGVVEGVVVDARGEGVEGVTVRANATAAHLDGPGVRSTTTGPSGRFRLDGLPHTDVRVVAASSLAASETYEIAEIGTAPFQLTLTLWHDAVIAGRVVNPDESPVVGAEVVCVTPRKDAPGVRPVRPVTTDTRGAFKCRGLIHGVGYFLTARRPQTHHSVGNWRRSVDAESMSGQRDVVLMIPWDGAIKGEVRTPDGLPARGFGISVVPASRPRRFEAPDGRFALEGVPPGEYELVVFADGMSAAVTVQVAERAVTDVGTVRLSAR